MAPQKRSADEAYSSLDKVDMILMDVEGTTTPVKFVTDTLFPYVKENVENYFTKHFDEEECQSVIKALRTLSEEDKDKEGFVEIPVTDDKDELIKAIVANVAWQMSEDCKSGALKQLQGHVLREGFKQGLIKAPLFDDVEPTLRKFSEIGKRVGIFSSGSIETQKLVFGHSEQGDMKDFISGYYDTTTGAKKDSESYKKIAEDCGVTAEKIMYLTDTPQEATAAAAAGMQVHLLMRPGNAPISDDDRKDLSCIESFSELLEKNEGVKRLETEEVDAGGDANGEAGSPEYEDDDADDDVDDDDVEDDDEEQ